MDAVLMIFRAVFWIGLVALLMPRAPGPAPERPAAGISLPSSVTSWTATGLSRPGSVCENDAAACAGGPTFLGSLQQETVRGLAAVKAEIDADRKARASRL
jgi:hypothetical protein